MSSYKYYEDIEDREARLGNYQTAEDDGGIKFKVIGACSKIEEEMTDANRVSPVVNYKYNEGKLLQELTEYINKTYGEHYSQNNYQATEFIIDGGHGTGFTLGNILKYAQRYGHKGTPTDWRKDLMKVLHYAIIALHVHDLQHKGK